MLTKLIFNTNLSFHVASLKQGLGKNEKELIEGSLLMQLGTPQLISFPMHKWIECTFRFATYTQKSYDMNNLTKKKISNNIFLKIEN